MTMTRCVGQQALNQGLVRDVGSVMSGVRSYEFDSSALNF